MNSPSVSFRPPSVEKMKRQGRWPPFVLVLVASAAAWLVLFVAIPPGLQDFPLDDDWAFGQGAMTFASTGRIQYFNWASMPQLGQWLWATPFLKLLGSSYVSLRLSTLLLSWLGLGAFYDLLRQERVSPDGAALATAALAFNPLFFLLQGTFLTDVPSLSMGLVALALYGRAFRSGSRALLALAVVSALFAVTTRQNLVTVPLVASPLWWRSGQRRRPLFFLGVLVPLLGAVYAHLWFQAHRDTGPVRPGLTPPYVMLLFPYLAVHFFGLATLPVLALRGRPRLGKGFVALTALLIINALYWSHWPTILSYGSWFPYRHNLLSPWGAFAGKTAEPLMPGDRPLVLGEWVRIGLTFLGCLAGAAWLVQFLTKLGNPETRRSPLWLFTCWQLVFTLIAPEVHDRYLLMLLPGALFLALGREAPARPAWAPAIGLTTVLALFSLCLMHDWLSWNAARWQLGERAVRKQGIAPTDIEGGFEWDGTYGLRRKFAKSAPERSGLSLEILHRWFPQITGAYALSFSVLPDTTPIFSEAYVLWLPPGTHRMYLLQYKPPAGAPPQPPAPAAPDAPR